MAKVATPKYWFVGVSVDSLYAVLSTLASGPLSWKQLLEAVIGKAYFKSSEQNVDTIVYQHMAVARLLDLARTSKATHRLARSGFTFITETAEDLKRSILRNLVFDNTNTPSPLGKFMAFFNDALYRTHDDFVRSANAIVIEYQSSRNSRVLGIDGTEIACLSSRAHVTEVYWGVRPFLISIDLIGEVACGGSSLDRVGTCSVLYPTNDRATKLSTQEAKAVFEQTVREKFAEEARISIARFKEAVCTTQHIQPDAFDELLRNVYNAFPNAFYLDRIPSVIVGRNEREYVSVNGEWRSFVIMGPESRRWRNS